MITARESRAFLWRPNSADLCHPVSEVRVHTRWKNSSCEMTGFMIARQAVSDRLFTNASRSWKAAVHPDITQLFRRYISPLFIGNQSLTSCENVNFWPILSLAGVMGIKHLCFRKARCLKAKGCFFLAMHAVKFLRCRTTHTSCQLQLALKGGIIFLWDLWSTNYCGLLASSDVASTRTWTRNQPREKRNCQSGGVEAWTWVYWKK